MFNRSQTLTWFSLVCSGALLGALESTAAAQMVPGTPYQRASGPVVYQDLSAPTVIWSDADDETADVNFGFEFKFYDQIYNSLTIDSNGLIGFPAGRALDRFNETPGASATHDNFIAPFWDDLQQFSGDAGSIGYQIEGTAPTRTLTLEWKRTGNCCTQGPFSSMQVRLFEGLSGRVEIDYGPTSGTVGRDGTMGMEDTLGARPIFFHPSMCTTDCDQAELDSIANTRVSLVQDPGIELAAGLVSPPARAFLGAETNVAVTVLNLHGASIGPFDVEVVASTDAALNNAVSIGTQQVSLGAFAVQTLSVTTVFPPSLGVGRIYVGLKVDSENDVLEVDENNNISVSAMQVRLLVGKADLAVQEVRINETAVAAGGSLQVMTTLKNVGSEPTGPSSAAVMLSANPVISPQDVELQTFAVDLQPGEAVTATRTVQIDQGTNTGNYYIGVRADPAGALDELSESNNALSAFSAIAVSGAALVITTPALQAGTVLVPYSAQLSALGGQSGDHTWEIVSGGLPEGLDIVAVSGVLFGVPSMVQQATFTARVTDSAGATAQAEFTIDIRDPGEPLTIVTREVLPAVVGQEYRFQLVATGGDASMYNWTATGLPAGLEISETGVLSGSASEPSVSDVVLALADGVSNAERTVSLSVLQNPNLLIVPDALPVATFGMPYRAELKSTGGVEPITWLLQLGSLPDGVDLKPDGVLEGTPNQAGTFRLVIEARDAGPGALAARDIGTFVLKVEDPAGGFSIVAEPLPVGVLGEGYDGVIRAEGGQPPYEWNIEEGRLQDGLLASVSPVSGDFRVAGAPSEFGVSNLLISVSDSLGRVARRAFVVEVLEQAVVEIPKDSGGCTATERGGFGGWSLILLGGFLLVWIRRR